MIRYVLGLTDVKVKKPGKAPIMVPYYWITSSEPKKTVYPERIGLVFKPETAKADVKKAKARAAELLGINPRTIEVDKPLEKYCG